MGSVFLARDLAALDRGVAIKVPDIAENGVALVGDASEPAAFVCT
jgi:hypothetical protein